MTDLFADSDSFKPATFSPCRTWRFRLERRWSAGPKCAFVLLNPSTADETKDDPTIRRCIGFAKAWGYGGLVLGNIFALRSTDPRGLYSAADPIGPGNDAALMDIANEVGLGHFICGWGIHGAFQGRGAAVLDRLREAGHFPKALRVTAEGFPGHPLYVAASTVPVYLK